MKPFHENVKIEGLDLKQDTPHRHPIQLLARVYAIYLIQGPFVLGEKVFDFCLS
jgi:hypothetical protein